MLHHFSPVDAEKRNAREAVLFERGNFLFCGVCKESVYRHPKVLEITVHVFWTETEVGQNVFNFISSLSSVANVSSSVRLKVWAKEKGGTGLFHIDG